VVAGLDAIDRGTDLLDHAGGLVANTMGCIATAVRRASRDSRSGTGHRGNAHQNFGRPGGSSVIGSIDAGAPTLRNSAARLFMNYNAPRTRKRGNSPPGYRT